jgi:LacI family transcriptional regulator
VHQSGYQLGATAARIVLDRVAGDDGPAKHCVLQTELKVRESVAALSGAAMKSEQESRKRAKKAAKSTSRR